MNKRKKKLIREALVAALPYLAAASEDYFDGKKDAYLCFAIQHAARSRKCTAAASVAAQAHIMSMLGVYAMCDVYLQRGLHIDQEFLTFENVQDYRKRWAEHMIEEFSS